MTAIEDLNKQYRYQIVALQDENQRLNEELSKLKKIILEIKLSDPIFFKPINEIEVEFKNISI